jgi:ABC-2 type transport system ATP-binding protein
MVLSIRADGLRKRYRGGVALDGVDLAVPAGTVHALLGPNGAGKTTAVRILATLLRPDGGRAEVAGHDVVRQPAQVRRRIGVVGQRVALDDTLTGRQNLVMFARLHHLRGRAATARSDELLARFGLADAAGRAVRRYSGGMRRRLDLAASLVLAPPVLFLDEPTTGLDPAARAALWQDVRALAATGTAVLLTTQYLDEADQLAGTVSVLKTGRIIARGTPDELKSRLGDNRIEIVVRHPADLPEAIDLVAKRCGEVDVSHENRRLTLTSRDPTATLTRLLPAFQEADLAIDDLQLRRPTLDEVFLHVTGGAA